MKIEMGESIIFSWLKHIKNCQIVQLNWKPSSRWEVNKREVETIKHLETLSAECFLKEFNYDLFKKNSGMTQVIAQAEIDVIGINCIDKSSEVYAVDVAFHEAGLNYGSKEETVCRVIKKCIRTAMCIMSYFNTRCGQIIFASPKINPAVIADLEVAVERLEKILNECNLNFSIKIIANEFFQNEILEPVIQASSEVSDTSELFMRSYQLFNVSKDIKLKQSYSQKRKIVKKNCHMNIERHEKDDYANMQVGEIARTILCPILEEGKILAEEINKMQEKKYSKDTFGINYPLLTPAKNHKERPKRYYKKTSCTIHNQEYYMCSEWFERNKSDLMLWIERNK